MPARPAGPDGTFPRSLAWLRRLPECEIACAIANDLVIHVGDVHDVTNPVSTLPQKTAQNVDCDEGTEVADMSVVVHRRPAGVHADFVIAEWVEFLNLRGHGVVETKRHSVGEQLRRTYDSRGLAERGSNRGPGRRSLCRQHMAVLAQAALHKYDVMQGRDNRK